MVTTALSYFAGNASSAAGETYLHLLDRARRMLSAADVELQAIAGVLDETENALVEGAQWSGMFWTQNSYGFGLASAPFLPDAQLYWLQNSYLWWFDHAGDGAQTYNGLADVPAGMLCDAGSPTGCYYMQCGPDRRSALAPRRPSSPSSVPAERTSKRLETMREQKAQQLGDTEGLGHDWIIEGSLAGVVMQAELLLATRNVSGARHFLPPFKSLSDFMETRRVQDESPLTPGAVGLFRAGSGANLLAPGFGGHNLPHGCLGNASCGTAGFPPCCTQRGMAYLAGLSVTYSAVLDRMIALEQLAYPGGRACTTPNSQTPNVSACVDVYRRRRASNDASLPALMSRMERTNTSYLIQAMADDGERYGVYAPSPPCPLDVPTCPPSTRHGYFESSPNVDAIALGVVGEEVASGIYEAMLAVPGLAPCGWTLPNFPDYDGACSNGGCIGGYGTWVSGGSWSTLEGRAILAHYRQRRHDLAAGSMARLLSPYAALFKLENPISHQGCGPGMYSEAPGRESGGGPSLDVDAFAIPAAFVRGLFGYAYGSDTLTLRPRLPPGLESLAQRFPVRWGTAQLFLRLERVPTRRWTSSSAADAAIAADADAVVEVLINGTQCAGCVVDADTVRLTWAGGMEGAPTVVRVRVGEGSGLIVDGRDGSQQGPGHHSSALRSHNDDDDDDAGEALALWDADEVARSAYDAANIATPGCTPNATIRGWASNVSGFRRRMAAAGLAARFEAAQATATLAALNVSAARCEGRADGSIAPMPDQPTAWHKYNVSYNQTEVEAYFDDLPGRIWRGLISTIASYDRDNASPVQAKILALFRGQAVESAQGVAERAATRLALDGRIEAAKAEVQRLQALRREL